MKKIGSFINRIGIPTFAVTALLILVLIVAAIQGQSITTLFTDMLRRVGMNGLLVLAMVPAIKSGTGPNFALPIGICGGLFSLVCCFEMNLQGWALLGTACLMAIAICTLMGFLYGKLLNAIKGAEMTIATYAGFSIVALFNIVWLVLPFTNKQIKWMLGDGLRETIQMDAFGADKILSNFLSFNIGNVTIPTGMLLLFLLCCGLVALFFNSKSGTAIFAGGMNPRFAEASGMNIDKNRIIANILSTVLAGLGIIIYCQGYGYAQLYDAPLNMAFPAVAAVLIGGATASKASCVNVIIGVLVYQGLMTAAMPVANQLFTGTDLSDIMRQIIQNGVILYALTKVKGGDQ